MNPLPLQTDPATEGLLGLLETCANDWTNRLAAAPLEPVIHDKLRGVVRRLARSRKEFASKLFILLVFGPLKSGKSTLVNCLVRSEVSPTALGISATKRPCIILGANGAPDSAEQYFATQRDPGTRLEAFESVIDHLRGLDEPGSLARLVEVKGLDCAEVHEALSREQRDGAREPLITALRVAEKSEERFLDEGVAVIDSPGLDDPANRRQTHEKTAVDWAVANADLCVLVHSSLAAPGADMLRFVAEIVAKDSAPPLVILQNRFDARLWRKADVVAAENDKQQQDTREQVTKALGGASQKVFKEFHANLGLASDRRFRHAEVDRERQRSLGLQDTLDEVQEAILGLVKDNREPLKRANCVNRLKEFLKPSGDGLKVLEDCQRTAQEIKDRHALEVADLDGLVTEVQVLQHLREGNSLGNDKLKAQEQTWAMNLMEQSDKLKRYWKETYGDGDPQPLKLIIRKQITGEVINEKCRQLAAELKQQVGLQVFNRRDAFGVELARTLTEELGRAEERFMPHANKALTALQLATVKTKPVVGAPELPDPTSVLGDFKFAELALKWWLLFDERYNTNQAQGQVDSMAGEIKKSMEAFRDRYAECVRKSAGEVAEKRKQELLAHLGSQKQELARRWQPELERAENTLNLVRGLKEELHQLATAANAIKTTAALSVGRAFATG